MYSVVLMMAMAGTGETPAGCFSGWGCSGYDRGCSWSCSSYSGCYSSWSCSSYSSCYSGGKHGCKSRGGLFGGRNCNGGGLFSGLFGKKSKGCSSCYSSCYSGCYSSCHGYVSCSHSCSGYVSCHGYSGCYSSCHGAVSCHGYNGCHAPSGCAVPYAGTPVVPHEGQVVPHAGEGAPAVNPAPEQKPADGKPTGNKPAEKDPADLPKVGDAGAEATLIVTLPADAKLTIDGTATSSTSARRVFQTPALEYGRQYGYTLKAEFEHQGKTVSLTREVVVEAGRTTTVQFDAGELHAVSAN